MELVSALAGRLGLLPGQPRPLRAAAAVGALLVPVAVASWLYVRHKEHTCNGPTSEHAKETTGDPPVNPARTIHRLPTTLPVLGNLLDVVRNKTRRHDWLASLCEQYQGAPFKLEILGRPDAVILSTPQAVEDCLKTQFASMPKGPVQCEAFSAILGHGIFAVDGDKWRHQRKTASNLFTTRTLRDSMAAIMRRHTLTLQEILRKAADTDTPLDLFKLLNRFTIEAFAEIGFGIHMNCLEAEEEHPFQSAFDSAQRMVALRMQRPIWFWKMQRALGLGAERQLKQDVQVIDDTVLRIIAESLARRQGSDYQADQKNDIISLFLGSGESGSRAFDPAYLRDIVVNFLIAGRDTTAQAMSWFFHSISQHPRVVAKIRAEIAELLPELANGSEQTPTMEHVQDLTYLEAALKETLRLYPSVPLLPKAVAKDVVLTDGTFLRKGTIVLMSAYSMGRMTYVWGHDAKEFKPERWIDAATGKLLSVSAFKFVSFNAGPRMCLGVNLAMLEMKIVVASLLSRFDIQELPGQHVTYDNSLTLPMRGEMLVRVANRQ